MFQRLAHNYIKNGYYPTDSETTQRILNALEPTQDGSIRIIDPCCGEGVALAELHHHLGHERTQSYGIEYNEERAYHAKELITSCIHGDIQNCMVGYNQFGLMWLNPPYGDLVTDQIESSTSKWKGKKRLEKLFYYLTNGYLATDGILVLIIPTTCFDKELSTWISRHFNRVQAFLAPEQRFKQVVVFGVRHRRAGASSVTAVRNELIQIGMGDLVPPELPEFWTQDPYVVPKAVGNIGKFKSVHLDARQVQDVITEQPGLWERFDLLFTHTVRNQRRPLNQLSEWHLALALAAGEVSGRVHSNDGRTYLIKGDTYKDKQRRTQSEIDEAGNITEVTIMVDKFVPAIRAIDFTESSESFGQILTIR